ncbi:hypothetical protein ACWDSJ_27675 [Nocardia sp. NPDC003482]
MTTALTADRLRTLLETGAAAADSRFQRAAIHLLAFTDLLGRAGVQDAHIQTDTVTIDGREVPAAWIRDWSAVGRLENLGSLTSGQERLVRLAASMAHGTPVDLRAALSELGHAHARCVLEAVAISLDADQYYTITPTPALIAHQNLQDELLADTLRLNDNGEPPRWP